MKSRKTKNREILLHVQWDSITLNAIPDETITKLFVEGYQFEVMYLGENDVVKTAERDTQAETTKTISDLSDAHIWDDYGPQGALIKEVIAGCATESECFEAWLAFLEEHLVTPSTVYYMGESVRTLPFSAKLTLEGLAGFDDFYGVMGKVRYKGDFLVVPFYDLETDETAQTDYDGLSDYNIWHSHR